MASDDSSLNIYYLTFNCARNLVDSTELASSLLSSLPTTTILPDILALSLQEIAPIANSFLGGSLIEPYLAAIAQTVSLAAKQRLNSSSSSNVSVSIDNEARGDVAEGGLVHVLTRHVGLTALMIFARPEIKSRIKWIKTAGVGCGLWEMGNKGAVGARFGIQTSNTAASTAASTAAAAVASNNNGVGDGDDNEHDKEDIFEVTFVAAHLAPHEQNVARRNQDFETIVRNLGFTNEEAYRIKTRSRKDSTGFAEEQEEEELLLSETDADKSSDALGLYDTSGLVFFAGDLNYRTAPRRPVQNDSPTFPQSNSPRNSPLNYLNFLSRDQLRQEMASNRVLQHFSEEDIAFPPTYKYIHGSPKQDSPQTTDTTDTDETWHWAPHRWPSWCDRILFFPSLAKSDSKSHSYSALPVQTTSDHRPVALSVTVNPTQIHSTSKSPYPLSPDFATVRASARRLEILVGVVSYLGLTTEGKTILAGIFAGAIASWYVVHSVL